MWHLIGLEKSICLSPHILEGNVGAQFSKKGPFSIPSPQIQSMGDLCIRSFWDTCFENKFSVLHAPCWQVSPLKWYLPNKEVSLKIYIHYIQIYIFSPKQSLRYSFKHKALAILNNIRADWVSLRDYFTKEAKCVSIK